MAKEFTNPTWNELEAGRDYDRRIGFLSNLAQNERFYRGDQWKISYGKSVDSGVLPTPVFNIVRRIVDYLVSQVSASDIEIVYSDENIALLDETRRAEVAKAVDLLNRSASVIWQKSRMDRLVRNALYDAALSGDGVFFTYWDPSVRTGQAFTGDFVTTVVDSSNLFVANVNSADIQSQEYVMLSGRDSVHALRAEALAFGISTKEIEKILPDDDLHYGAGDMAAFGKTDSPFSASRTDGKATFVIKFTKDRDGYVTFEKSVKDVVIRVVKTRLRLYPIAMFSWIQTKNSYHGTSPVTGLIQNQKYINKAYALMMKHMIDSAFSKVIYDKSRIPEWTNEVGQAIGVVGGELDNVATTFTPGGMDSNYAGIINDVIQNTKEVMGATEASLGETNPTNTSAIIALQESNSSTLESVRVSLYGALEDLAAIWLDFMCAYYADGRLLCGGGRVSSWSEGHSGENDCVDCAALREELIRAKVNVGKATRYSEATVLTALKELLDKGHITLRQYLERIPDGIIPAKDALIAEISEDAGELGGNSSD